MNNLQIIQKKLEEAKKIAIFTHINPDGDALGSSFALKIALESLGKTATVLLEKPIPEKYEFLNEGYSLAAEAGDFDTAIALDCGSPSRLGSFEALFDSVSNRLVLDHHHSDAPFGDAYYSETGSAACAELVYVLIKNMCGTLPDKILIPIFTGISTDTGQFKYSNVTPRTFRIAAELLEAGLDHRDITRRLYDTAKLKKLKFTGAVGEKIQLFDDGKIAVLECFDDFLQSYGLTHEEVEELPNTVLSIEGVLVAALIKTKDENNLKVSLRGKENIDLSQLAAAFGGGGHKYAAAFVSPLSSAALTRELVEEIKKRLEAFYG